MTIEQLFTPPACRPPPTKEEASHEYELLRLFMLFYAQDEEVWWNNVPVSLRTILEGPDGMEDVYCGVSEELFGRFARWKDKVGRGVDVAERHYACEVLGRVRDVPDPALSEVSFRVEDVLLHWHAYNLVVSDVACFKPDWVPFFFRGGVPLGLALVAKKMEEFKRRNGTYPSALPWLTWLPGLGHSKKRVGANPADLFRRELEARRNQAWERLHVWVLDATFTGSTAFGNVTAALRDLKPGPPALDVTLAMLFPVEQNVERNIKSVAERDRFNSGLTSSTGDIAWLRDIKRPRGVRNLFLRLYPVAKSLTEDHDGALELAYGEPKDGRPTFLRRLSQNLTIKVLGNDREFVKQLTISRGLGPRGDTAHDWVLNEVHTTRLPAILQQLGLSPEPASALADLHQTEGFRQYGVAPRVFNFSE